MRYDNTNSWVNSAALSEAQEIEAGLSQVLAHGIDEASPEDIEKWLEESVSQLSPVESYSVGKALQDIGRLATKQSGLRQVVGQALPTVGTIVGTAYGGPVGAAVGSQLGQVAGRAVTGAPPKPEKPSATPAMEVPLGAPGDGGTKAAGALLHVIQNPAFLTSLLALVLGAHGRTSIHVAGKEVPVGGAFLNLVSTLAGQAAQGAQATSSAAEEAVPSYLTDPEGQLLVDPVDPVQRANALLRLLEEDSESVLLDQENSEDDPEEYRTESWDESLDESVDPDAWDVDLDEGNESTLSGSSEETKVFRSYAPPMVWGPWEIVVGGGGARGLCAKLAVSPLGDTQLLGQVRYWPSPKGPLVEDFIGNVTVCNSGEAGLATISVRFKGVPLGTAVEGTVDIW